MVVTFCTHFLSHLHFRKTFYLSKKKQQDITSNHKPPTKCKYTSQKNIKQQVEHEYDAKLIFWEFTVKI